MKKRISHLRKVDMILKKMNEPATNSVLIFQCQAMEDVSMVAQIEGFKHEQLLFVDEVLKQLGEYQPTKKKSPKSHPSPFCRQRSCNRGGKVSAACSSLSAHHPTVRHSFELLRQS